MIGTSQLINTFSRPCFTDTTDIFKDGSGVALYGLDYDASDAGGASGKFGEAAIFNGSSSVIDLGSPLLGQTHSVSLWFNADSITTDTEGDILFAQYTSGVTGRYIISIYANTIRIFVGGSTIQTISATWTANAWTHFVIVKNSSGYEAFVNGFSIGTSSLTSNIDTASNTTIGAGRVASPFKVFPGSIDQVRIFNTALTQPQVTQLYQENSSTVGTHLFGCIANYNLDGSAKESMGTTAYDGTETDITYRYDGTPTAVDFGVGGKSLYGARFNGSSSYIDLGTSLLSSRSAFSVSTWVNFDNLNTQNFIFYNSESGTGGNVGFYDFGNGSIYFQPDASTSANRGYISNSGIYTTDEWVHIVMVFDGSATGNSNRLKAYIQGTERTLTYDGTIPSSTGTSTANSWIGGRSSTKFSGDIDQVRVFSKALSSNEVGKLYGNGAGEIACAYTSTTDNVAYPIANTAYYKLDNNSKDSARSTGKFNEGAIFNGSSSKIAINSLSLTETSISLWVNISNLSKENYVFSFNYSATNSFLFFYNNNNNQFELIDNAGAGNAVALSSTNPITQNQWHHLVLVVTSTTTTLYIDGSAETPASNNRGTTAFPMPFELGYATTRNKTTAYFSGQIDQVRIYNTALDSTDVSNLYAETVSDTSTLSFPSGKTAIATYQLDGNSTDLSGNYNGTDTNITYAYDGAETNIEHRFGRFGQAAVFNGSSSYIDTGISSLGANFSVSMWINEDALGSGGFFGNWNGTSNDDMFWLTQNDGSLRISIDGTSNQYFGSAGDVTINTWHHIVVSFNSGTYEVYLDSNSLGTATTSNTVFNSGANFFIGRDAASNPVYFDGKIDQVRIFDKAISAEDVATLYAETTSTASNTNPFSEGAGVALYTLDYDASEASGYYDGTPTNVEFGVGGKINYGARFNGSSSRIESNIDVFNTTTYSVSLWANVGSYKGASYNHWAFIINNDQHVVIGEYPANTLKIYFSDFTTSNPFYTITDPTAWYNIVVTRSGNSISMYVNGVLANTFSYTGLSQGTSFKIGTNHVNNDFFDGKIDQVRIFSKALNQTEVDTLFVEAPCVYTCTTDTVNYPSGTTPVAYYKLDNSSEDYVGGNDGSDTNVEYTFGRFGQAAVFNGSSSYINLGNSIITGAFSLSFWVNTSNITTAKSVFDFENSTYNAESFIQNGIVHFRIFDGGTIYFVVQSTLGDISINTWHNITYIFPNTTVTNGCKIYIDGVEAASGTSSAGGLNLTSTTQRIGSRTTNSLYWLGKIDQVRIYSAALTSSQVTELYEEKPCADTSNFKAVLYEGNGDTSNPTYISNVGFDLDVDNGGDGGLVWVKARTTNYNHLLMDSVRGTTSLTSNDNTTEKTNYNRFQGYEANGFSILANNAADLYKINRVGQDYVAWVWKGGGDAVNIGVNSITGSTPSIASDVSANTAAGFSIVKFTVPASGDFTVAHGLDNPPEMVITKSTDTFNWFIFHKDLSSGANGKYALQFTTAAESGSYKWWGNGMTSDVIGGTANTSFDPSTETIAYCFHSVAGYSKIGSYSGTGVSGKEVALDFNPSFVLIKRTNASTGWIIIDNQRGTKELYPNLPNAEDTTTTSIVLGTNKFTLNTTGSWYNASGGNYLYMAFK